MRQAELVQQALRALPGVSASLVTIQTTGDRNRDAPIAELGDKAVFVRAIELSLLAGHVDLAVHSLKDIPADVVTPELELVAYTAREDARDVLISRTAVTLDDLPSGARIGTSSLRRRVQLRHLRPDLDPVDIRGNVDTRLRKLDSGEYDAIVLAAAGLIRLGLERRISEYFGVDRVVPDAGQGIIAVQARVGADAGERARGVNSDTSALAAAAERAVVRALGADCRSPVGVHALVEGESIRLRGIAASRDGSRVERAQLDGPRTEPEALGARLGHRLRSALSEGPDVSAEK